MGKSDKSLLLKVPHEALPLLLLQRSEYRWKPWVVLMNLRARINPLRTRENAANSFANRLEISLFGGRIASLYNADMRRHYDNIAPYLPARFANVLDIGCGLGGINAFVYASSENKPEIWLLDKDGISSGRKTGYHPSAKSFSNYNSFAAAKAILKNSGIPQDKIMCIDIATDPFPAAQKFDCIYSFLSWGFHYPLETYAKQVREALSDKGVLILDVRRGTAEADKIEAMFARPARVILDAVKFQRYAIGRSV